MHFVQFQLNDASISAIVTNLRKLKELYLTSHSLRYNQLYHERKNLLSDTELNELLDKAFNYPSITPHLKALATSNICLESLRLTAFCVEPKGFPIITSLKTINTLSLFPVFIANGTDLIPLGTQLLSLKRIAIFPERCS